MTEKARLRADAHRNRELILAMAREVILEQGVDASLEEIARRAGVGIATLYRRFPNRRTLLEEIAADNLGLVGEELDRATFENPDAWSALRQFLGRVVQRRLIIFPALAPGLEADPRGTGRELQARRGQLLEGMEQLVHRARHDGSLRQGVDPITIWLGIIKLSRPLPAISAELNAQITNHQLELFLGSLHAVALDASEPLRHQPPSLSDLDRHLGSTA